MARMQMQQSQLMNAAQHYNTGIGAAKMGAMGGANGIGHPFKPIFKRVPLQPDDAAVVEYVVGSVPEDVIYQPALCPTINHLPEKFHEAAMLLYAAVSGEGSVRIPGVGSARLLEDGCLYFRFYD